MLGVGFLPLFGGPGYEQSLASGLLVPSAAAIATAFDLRDRDAPSAARVLSGAASRVGLVARGDRLRDGARARPPSRHLRSRGGAIGFALTAGFGALLGGALGSRRRRGDAPATHARHSQSLGGGLSAAARHRRRAWGASTPRRWSSRSTRSSDTSAAPSTTPSSTRGPLLVTYRIGSLATILASCWSRPSSRAMSWTDSASRAFSISAAAFVRRVPRIACVLVSLGITAYGAELGHWETSATIAEQLRGTRVRGRAATSSFPTTVLPDEAALLVKDCDEELAAVEHELGAHGPIASAPSSSAMRRRRSASWAPRTPTSRSRGARRSTSSSAVPAPRPRPRARARRRRQLRARTVQIAGKLGRALAEPRSHRGYRRGGVSRRRGADRRAMGARDDGPRASCPHVLRLLLRFSRRARGQELHDRGGVRSMDQGPLWRRDRSRLVRRRVDRIADARDLGGARSVVPRRCRPDAALSR
jgi:hypothetical protein